MEQLEVKISTSFGSNILIWFGFENVFILLYLEDSFSNDHFSSLCRRLASLVQGPRTFVHTCIIVCVSVCVCVCCCVCLSVVYLCSLLFISSTL